MTETQAKDGHPHEFPELEEKTRELGKLVEDAVPPGHGFHLCVFEMGESPSGWAWTTNLQIGSVGAALREIADRLYPRLELVGPLTMWESEGGRAPAGIEVAGRQLDLAIGELLTGEKWPVEIAHAPRVRVVVELLVPEEDSE